MPALRVVGKMPTGFRNDLHTANREPLLLPVRFELSQIAPPQHRLDALYRFDDVDKPWKR